MQLPILHSSYDLLICSNMASMALLAVLLVAAIAAAAAAGPSAAPQAAPPMPTACSWPSINVVPCIGYFTGGSLKPTAECCAQMRTLLDSQAPCACAGLKNNGSVQLAPMLNQTMVYTVAKLCGMPDNPCSDLNAEAPSAARLVPAAAAPTATAAPVPAAPTNAANSPPRAVNPGGASKTVPTAAAASSAIEKNRGVVTVTVLFLSMVAYASSYL